MRTAWIRTAAVALLVCAGGCMWPAATYVHGPVTVALSAKDQPAEATALEPCPRVVVVKYWSIQRIFGAGKKKFEFFGAQAFDRPRFDASFPVRFYPAIWTPVLGTQHMLPDAGLIVFADGYWPIHVIADDGRRCCEAPTTGQRHWHALLRPMDGPPTSTPPAAGWTPDGFPPLTPDKLESVLKWSGSLTNADREMCRVHLHRLLECRRQNLSRLAQQAGPD